MTTFSHLDPAARKARFGKGSPDQGAVYVVPELNAISVAYMLKPETLIANRLVPSVNVTQQSGKYAEYPRGYFFRDEMKKRADGAESAGSGFEVNFDASFFAEVYAYHVDAGPQMRANAKSIDVDRICTQLATNKALLKREKFFYDNFWNTGVWTTQVQGKTSGGGGTANVDLSWADASAKPIKQIKKAVRTAQELTGFKMNKATFSAESWDVFCEHPNVISRVQSGQTPGGPAEITQQMVAGWLGLKEVLVAESVIASNPPGHASANALSFMDTHEDALLLTYTPDSPSIMEPSAFYFFDWVADGLVGQFGNAVSKWWNQDRKSLRYEIEMATEAKKVAADCGIWMYDLLAT
jgi:hypothetical protein